MKHEKIIKREDGSQVLIEVSIYTDHVRENTYRYDAQVAGKGKGKRNWMWNANAATPEEIHAAKIELWEKLKPVQVSELK